MRNQYNQVPYLIRNTILYGRVTKTQHDTQENQEVKPFPASDHKAARNRLRNVSITKVNMKHKNGQQKIFGGLKHVSLNIFYCQI